MSEARRAIASLMFFCGLVACGREAESESADGSVSVPPPVATAPYLTPAQIPTGPSSITLTPTSVTPGGLVSITFDGPLRSHHGGYYVIYEGGADGNPLAILWSDKFVEPGIESPGYSLELTNFVVLDFAVIDGTPDTVVIPPSLQPGRYTLCTENSIPNPCADLQVV